RRRRESRVAVDRSARRRRRGQAVARASPHLLMDARLLLAFTTGMVMTVNPCGFAMLPAYLSFFVGIEDASDDQSTTANVARALLVSAAVTVGFVSTFAIVGLIANLLTENVF